MQEAVSKKKLLEIYNDYHVLEDIVKRINLKLLDAVRNGKTHVLDALKPETYDKYHEDIVRIFHEYEVQLNDKAKSIRIIII